eukprot:GHRQ01033974.1.p1 GENE.GHRQ01033974.1~~GHRQ01033974.1.p1  ORF type:complete len:285 (+),score=108.47 GHRQ01033974.1:461-1315(+)
MAAAAAQQPTTQTAHNSSSTSDGDLGIDSSLLYESFTDAVAHCAAGAYLAVQAFFGACKSPVVINTMKKTSKTVILTALCHYVLLTIVLWPVGMFCRLLSRLTLNHVNFEVNTLVGSSMAIYPMLTIMLNKYVHPSSMDDCFCSSLAELDPKYAAHLAAMPRRFKPRLREKVLARMGMSADDSDDYKTMLLLMLAGLLLRGWRSLPYIGWLVAPVLQFLSIRYMVGRPVAAALLSVAAALHPTLEGPVMSFVQLWASSKVLGRSSMRYYLDRCVPTEKRGAFIR